MCNKPPRTNEISSALTKPTNRWNVGHHHSGGRGVCACKLWPGASVRVCVRVRADKTAGTHRGRAPIRDSATWTRNGSGTLSNLAGWMCVWVCLCVRWVFVERQLGVLRVFVSVSTLHRQLYCRSTHTQWMKLALSESREHAVVISWLLISSVFVGVWMWWPFLPLGEGNNDACLNI